MDKISKNMPRGKTLNDLTGPLVVLIESLNGRLVKVQDICDPELRGEFHLNIVQYFIVGSHLSSAFLITHDSVNITTLELVDQSVMVGVSPA